MIPVRPFAAAIVLVVALLSGFIRSAEAQEIPLLDAETRRAAVEKIGRLLVEHHVFPEVGKACCDHIMDRLEKGAYDGITDHFVFAEALTRDLQSVKKDLHMQILVNANVPIAVGGSCCGAAADSEDLGEAMNELERDNFGFKELRIFDGNVGYLDLTFFAPAEAGAETAAAAMNFLANSDAVIIDLRHNGGGGNEMLLFLASYFIRGPTHLDSIQWRGKEEAFQSWTLPHVPGKKMYDTPLFLLVGEETGSAAEAFAYNLKQIGRARIIGRTTAGAAHPVTFNNVMGFFKAQIPSAQVFNQVTGTDWEGVGVKPHLETARGKTLLTARVEALKTVCEQDDARSSREQIRWTMQDLEAELNPITLSGNQLGRYVGDYGPRHVTLKDGVLYYQRDGRPPYRLKPISEDLFVPEGNSEFKVYFDRNGVGPVDFVEIVLNNGLRDRSNRDA